ncbi:MAG: methyltransferase [Oscillospiraceae bacterium]|nr:methyltransferase [Oscillospiraceae bacterium]
MNELFDEFPDGGPKFLKKGAYPIGTDAVLLARFAGRVNAGRICDLGCGSGVIAALLLWERQSASAVGLELDPAAAETARKNAAENGLDGRFEIITGDIREHRALGMAGAFDLTVSNPPYYPAGSGKTSPVTSRALSRAEGECSLKDVCAAAAYFTRWGGSFCIVQKPERLSEVLCAMTEAGLEPKRLRLAEAKPGKAPSLVLVEARRGGKPGLVFEPAIILETENK